MQIHASALSELRLATQEIHQTLERHLAVAQPGATKLDYLHYLQDLWGWLLPFETRLWNAPWPVKMQAHERAGKLAWIESDLRAADLDANAIARLAVCGFSPDLECLHRRFGVAYVVEGAQLGTKVLGKRLAPSLAPWSSRWLAGYGERNGQNWRMFIECAERHLASEDARSKAAGAAVEAFTSLATWFAERKQARDAAALPDLASKGRTAHGQSE